MSNLVQQLLRKKHPNKLNIKKKQQRTNGVKKEENPGLRRKRVRLKQAAAAAGSRGV